MLGLTPMRTTMLWVQLVCTAEHRSSEFAHCTPFSRTWATWIGPDRGSVAPKARWTTPKEPAQGLLPPFLQVFPPVSVPFVSAQSSLTSAGPAPGASVNVVGELQTCVVASYVSVRVVPAI